MTEGPRVNFVMREALSKFTRGSSVFHSNNMRLTVPIAEWLEGHTGKQGSLI